MADFGRRAAHLDIRGRVQGVGFRDFVRRAAAQRQLDGWVRNRHDGSVEAVAIGSGADVAEFVEACREGPPGAKVSDVQVSEHAGTFLAGFRVLPTE